MINRLVSDRNQRSVGWSAGLVLFAVLLLAGLWIAEREVRREMDGHARRGLDQFVRQQTDLDGAFAQLAAEATATPCSPLFREQLRRVAYRPDGFNEFLFAPGGVVACSTSADLSEEPVRLGRPDFAATASEPALWIDRGLAFTGLRDLVGSIALRGPFAIVIPPRRETLETPAWLDVEVVLIGEGGRWWHRDGLPGLLENQQIASGPRAPAVEPYLRGYGCLETGRYCAVTRASLFALLEEDWSYAIPLTAAAGLASAALGVAARRSLQRYFSFDRRFVRHLDAGSLACVYQPIVELGTGRIAGCEVLARWHDVDGSLVYPDRFIPLVEKHGLTLKLTRLVIERARAELAALPPAPGRLFVTFNIFPRDLDCAALQPLFRGFAPLSDRFDLVVELVESDTVAVDCAQREIRALREIGIRTFIDDFGTGYSNIQNLAALSVDGVKLDRAFAMAPPDGMMAEMLGHAIRMIQTSAPLTIVEGVETEARLQQLREMVPPVTHVQGYHLSRPIGIERLRALLEAERQPPSALAA